MVRLFTDACASGPPKLCGLFVDSYTTSPFTQVLICKSCFSSKSRLAQLSTNSCYENSRMTGITRMSGTTRMTKITGRTEMNWTNRVTGTTGMTTKDDSDD